MEKTQPFGRASAEGTDTYTYDTSRSQVTTLPGTDNDSTWLPDPPWDWRPPAADSAVAYETAALTDDTVMVGTGSVDLWLQADADDVDVQVTLSEVRPDGSDLHAITDRTTTGSGNCCAAWSPTGQRILFQNGSDTTSQLWTMASDGSGARQLTTDPGFHAYSSWSVAAD